MRTDIAYSKAAYPPATCPHWADCAHPGGVQLLEPVTAFIQPAPWLPRRVIR